MTTQHVEVKSLAAYSKNSKPFTSKTGVHLDIVPVQVLAGGGVVQTHALLNTGSDRTFCERRLAQELGGRKLPVKLSVQTISSKQPCVTESSAVSFDICSLNKSHRLVLSDVVVIDDIPVIPFVIPNPECIQQYSHLSDISLPVIDGGSMTILVGNDYVTAHRCLESRFSSNPKESPDVILTPLDWVLRGPHLSDHCDPLDEISSNFLVRSFEWPPDM